MPDDSDARVPRKRYRTTALIVLTAFVLGAALVLWAVTRWQPARDLIAPPPPYRVTPAPAPLVARPAAPLPAIPGDATAPEQIVATEARVAGVEARLVQIDRAAALASANASRAEGLLIAFAARRTIDRGAPLNYLEGQLRERFASTQPRAVAAIIGAAQRPVTLDVLSERFDVLAPDLGGGGKGESWWSATRRVASSLIIVRRADTPSPAPGERIARIRRLLAGGQVDAAMAEVARMPAQARAADWMSAATRYVEAHRALDILEAAAIVTPQPNTDTAK